MSAAAGNKGNIWRPTPPQKGSFPLDHDNECSSVMKEYLDCMQIVRGTNAPGCRLLAKKYLKCRMDNGLMDQDSWENLGLPLDDQQQRAQDPPVESPGNVSINKD